MKKYRKFLIVMIIVMIPLFFLQSDDKELFMGLNIDMEAVKPNVVILMDSSEIMNSVMWYPKYGLDGEAGTADDGYDLYENYTGLVDGFGVEGDRFWENDTSLWQARWIFDGNAEKFTTAELGTYATGCYADDGTAEPTDFQVGGNGSANFEIGDRIIYMAADGASDAMATIEDKYTVTDPVSAVTNTWIKVKDVVGGPIEPIANAYGLGHNVFQKPPNSDYTNYTPVIVRLYGDLDYVDLTKKTLYDRNYLKWLYLHATDDIREAVTHFSTYGTFDTTEFPGWVSSACTSDSKTETKYTFTRIQVAREVACKVAEDSVSVVKLGLFKYKENYGADMLDVLNDMSEAASMLNDYKNTIYTKVSADGAAPMAEALADVWFYLRPHPGGVTWQPVNYDTAVGNTSLFEYWCQNTYIVVMSSGESTYDVFDDANWTGTMFADWPVRRADTWAEWKDGWGDTDYNEAGPDDSDVKGIPAGYDSETSYYCPNWTCWQRLQSDGTTDLYGSDYLDDLTYFMANSDLFPEKNVYGADLYNQQTLKFDGWPGFQRMFTYTIGFGTDSDLLRDAAINGKGAYYTANNYEELVQAFRNVITSILLRNFAFSAITAPKKTATAANTVLQISYVGYFLPSQAASIWEGHLLAYELIDKWGYDMDGSGTVEIGEYIYDNEEDCFDQSSECNRMVKLSEDQAWDAADRVPEVRNLYSNDKNLNLLDFKDTNRPTLKLLMGVGDADSDQIVATLRKPNFGDVFHSDVGFVCPPLLGKKYLHYINPLDPSGEQFETFYHDNEDRRRVLYVGTNDGILHMITADDITHVDGRDAGKELWGLIPDVILPKLKDIVIDGVHTYTMDGRLTAEDIYYVKDGDANESWATVMALGLRSGGNAYYQLDVTEVDAEPDIMWKFVEPDYSGESWGKPLYGRVKIEDASATGGIKDTWVVIFTGGFAYSHERSDDLRGKALFIVDAASGKLLWMVAYDSVSGGADANGTLVQVTDSDGWTINKRLTKSAAFNFPIASAVSAVDKDYDGFLDHIFMGNVGGSMFRVDLTVADVEQWKTTQIYESEVVTTPTAETIVSITGNLYDLKKALVTDNNKTVCAIKQFHITSPYQNSWYPRRDSNPHTPKGNGF